MFRVGVFIVDFRKAEVGGESTPAIIAWSDGDGLKNTCLSSSVLKSSMLVSLASSVSLVPENRMMDERCGFGRPFFRMAKKLIRMRCCNSRQ